MDEFFQGIPLNDSESFSEREYWAFVMASSLQFSAEKPIAAIAPIGELKDGESRVLLVYPVRRSLVTAPELGLFPGHVVYGFERENGTWKMMSFLPNTLEATLDYWFLQQKRNPIRKNSSG